MAFRFGSRSERIRRQLHPLLQKILERAIETSEDDFGLHEGQRSIELQHKYFLRGDSHIDGINRRGYHNYTPALAFDFHASAAGKTWGHVILTRIARHIQKIAIDEFELKLVWGGDWRTLDDKPHLQLPGRFRKEAERLKLY